MTKKTIDTGTTDLDAYLENGVAVITMNRPERRNALTGPMLAALSKALADAELNPEVGAVVLTGAGGAFCAGGDVKAMSEANASAEQPSLDAVIHGQRVNQRETSGRLFKMPKPTIAALPGAAAGAGLSLALACDLRVASENAIMTTAFAKVGLAGDYGGTFFMTRLIGAAKAREFYFLSDKIDMQEALRLNLVNWVVPAEQLLPKAIEIAERLASGPTVTYRYIKENLNRAFNGDWDDCLDLEVTHHVHTSTTEDHKEAAMAFVEKRAPSFKGR